MKGRRPLDLVCVLTEENLALLRADKHWTNIKVEYLTVLGRTTQFPSSREWWRRREEWRNTREEEFWRFQRQIADLAERYDVAPWVIERDLAIKGYHPSQEPYVWEASWPRVSVTTDQGGITDRLLRSCWQIGVPLRVSPPRRSQLAETHDPEPEWLTRIWAEVQLPPAFPPGEASKLTRKAVSLLRGALKLAGYPVALRARSTPADRPELASARIHLLTHRTDLANQVRAASEELTVPLAITSGQPSIRRADEGEAYWLTGLQAVVQLPANLPADAAGLAGRQATKLLREVLRRAGYRVPYRFRPVPTAADASKLRLSKGRLQRGELGDIALDLSGDGDDFPTRREIRAIKSRRHKLVRRAQRLGPS